jgi:intein/homing endonuclease
MTSDVDLAKAYLLGAFMGDGCVYYDGKHCVFRLVSLDQDFVEKVAHCCEQLTGRRYRIKPYRKNKVELYKLWVCSRKIYDFLIQQTEQKRRLPKLVNESKCREVKAAFIAGLMDSDGYISMGTLQGRWQRFSMGFVNSGAWLEEFKSLLQSLGVKVGCSTLKRKYRSSREKDCFQININIRSFVESGLYFGCHRKQTKLEQYKMSVRYQSYHTSSETVRRAPA